MKPTHSVQSIIEHFLEDDTHKHQYIAAYKHPTAKNQKTLDEAFRQYFRRIKTIQYISRLISGYSVDFDKRMRSKQSLSLEVEKKSENNTSLLTFLQSGDVLTDLETKNDEHGDTDELFEDKRIASCFAELKSIQQTILVYSYFYGYKNKEIAKHLNVSEQRVSYYKKRALTLLKKAITDS